MQRSTMRTLLNGEQIKQDLPQMAISGTYAENMNQT